MQILRPGGKGEGRGFSGRGRPLYKCDRSEFSTQSPHPLRRGPCRVRDGGISLEKNGKNPLESRAGARKTAWRMRMRAHLLNIASA